VFRQVFVFQQYMPVTKLESPTVIVDCGANAGYSALFFLKHFPEARVIAVEPDPNNAELCRHNLHPFLDRVVVIQKALWGRVTKLSFVEESRRPGEEWGIQVQSTPTSSAEDAVEAIDIPSLMEATDLTFIDILKIDIEKSEADVFQANPTAWLHLVRNIAIELHGPTCTEAFRAALKGYSFSEEVCGEITLCLGMKPSLLT
jgi:FkbM family methyltransferase